MSNRLFLPCTCFKVIYQYSSQRPFCSFDQALLQFIASEMPLSQASLMLGIPTRMVVESAFDLLKERMLEMTEQSLQITSIGNEYKNNLVEYPRAEIIQTHCRAWYDWNHDCVKIIHFQEEGYVEKDPIYINIMQPFNDDEKVVYGQLYYDYKAWMQKSLQEGIFFTERYKDGIYEKITATIRHILEGNNQSLYMIESIEAPRSIFKFARIEEEITTDVDIINVSTPDTIPQCPFSTEDWLLTGEMHRKWLKEALCKTQSDIFIFSAHEHISALKSILSDRKCNVMVHLIPGYHSVSSEIKFPHEVQHYENGTDSDMKLVLYNNDSGWHVALGSYNWLSDYSSTDQERPGQGDEQGIEISILLNDTKHAATMVQIIDILKKLSSLLGPKQAAILKALERIKKNIKDRISDGDESLLLTGQAVEYECGYALRNTKTRCIVCSHSIGQHKDSLSIVSDRQKPTLSTFLVAFAELIITEKGNIQKANREQIKAYQKEKEHIVKKAGKNGILLCRLGLHSRIIIRDDVVTISSLNVLSSYKAATTTFGVRFQDKISADFLEKILLKLVPKSKSISIEDKKDIIAALLTKKSTPEAEAEKYDIAIEIILEWYQHAMDTLSLLD